MIAITGASGHLGKATITFLLEKVHPSTIIAVVRDAGKVEDLIEKGVQVRIADYNDPASLRKAFAGVQKLLQVSAISTGEQGIREELNVVEAAVKEDVPHICYTSVLQPSANPKFQSSSQCMNTERAILESGMRYTIFGNSLYMETIPLFIGNALQDGNIYLSAGNGKVSFVYRKDIAAALANVLTQEGHENKRYEISGSGAYGFTEVGGLLQTAEGLPVNYTDIPQEALGEELKKTGMPGEEIAWFLSLTESIKDGEFAFAGNDLEKLLQRPPLSLQDFVKAYMAPSVTI